MTFKPVLIEKLDELLQAYAAGRCDSYTTDASGLAAVRAGQLSGKGEHTILPERISKEPLGPIVRHGDDQWFDLVKWTLMGMIEAEEMGISSKNVDEMLKSDDPAIKRFLGVTPGYGKAVGVDEKWMYNIVKQIGNYGESFERNVGAATPLKLERGQNALWTNGGLMYAIPVSVTLSRPDRYYLILRSRAKRGVSPKGWATENAVAHPSRRGPADRSSG